MSQNNFSPPVLMEVRKPSSETVPHPLSLIIELFKRTVFTFNGPCLTYPSRPYGVGEYQSGWRKGVVS